MFEQIVILSGSEEREEAAAFLSEDEGYHGRGWNNQQIDEEDFPESQIIYEDQEYDWAQNTALGQSSFDRERR